jgi:hypothetical protein
MLRYFDDFLFFAPSKDEALLVRRHLDKVIDWLGLLRYPAKGLWKPT